MSFEVVNTTYMPGLDFGEKLLEPLGANLISGMWRTEEDLLENAANADAVICSGPSQSFTPRVLNAFSRCRILASLGIGYDRIHLETATQMGIVVTNMPDYCLDEVSTHTIALIMALCRGLFQIDREVRETQIHLVPMKRDNFKKFTYPVSRMRDQTLGIIGFGRIGTSVANKAKGLGMKIIAYDPYVLEGVMLSHDVTPVDLDTLLRESDYISINSSLNEETRGMIGHEEFKKMKPSSYLINTARGGIVEQSALEEALKEGQITGAGLDVTGVEPIPKDSPLLKMPNVILTGHSAWYSITSDSESVFWSKAMVQVISALKGEWPTYAVNTEVKKLWLEKWGK